MNILREVFNSLVQSYKDAKAHRAMMGAMRTTIENADAQGLSKILDTIELAEFQKDDFVRAIIRRNDLAVFNVAMGRMLGHNVNYSLSDVQIPHAPYSGGTSTTARTPIVAYAIQNGADQIALALVNNTRTNISARIEFDICTAFSVMKTYGPTLHEMAAQAGMKDVVKALAERGVSPRPPSSGDGCFHA